MENLEMKDAFDGVFAGKTVLVTGHTGFKGSWLSLWLLELGAKVAGLALPPNTRPSLYEQSGLARLMDSRLGDIRDLDLVEKTLHETRPDFIFHLAAQPLVRYSYAQPIETFAVNALGTAHVLEALRKTPSARVCQIITTDKCYENREADYAYKEDDRLGGRDPYSASKACAEIVVSSYRSSFFSKPGAASLSSTRAGNVIGGGDWAQDRLIPDCVRALAVKKDIEIRNPHSVRPWQYVLEPLSGYLRLASLQWARPAEFSEAWNFGPKSGSALPVSKIADQIVKAWGGGRWSHPSDPSAPHEAGLLQLDSSKSEKRLGWKPVYSTQEAVSKTVAWYLAAQNAGFEAAGLTRNQIKDYTALAHKAGLPWAKEGAQKAVLS